MEPMIDKTEEKNLITKWKDVLECDQGEVIRTQAEAMYVALALEIQIIANAKSTHEDVYYTQYFAPLIRREIVKMLHFVYSDENTFSLTDNVLDPKYSDMTIGDIVKSGEVIAEISKIEITEKYNQYRKLFTENEIQGLSFEYIIPKLSNAITEHCTKQSRLGFYWYEAGDNSILVKYF